MAAPFFIQEQPDSSRYRLAAEMAGRNQQPQQPTMNPMAMSKFMQGGGAASGGAGAAPYASMAGGGMGAGGGAGGASGGAGGIGAGGPWALLAAAIIGNELAANEAGRRPESKGKWAKELATGEVLERDLDYYGGKVGGAGGEILEGLGTLSNPFSTFKKLKDIF